jgi:hypothetical protein
MGVYLIFCVIGIPCLVFDIWCLTPSGKAWRRANGLL